MKSLLVWCILTTCIILVATTYRKPQRGCIPFIRQALGGLHAKLTDQQEEVSDVKEDVTDIKEDVTDLKEELNNLRLELSPKEVDGQWTDWLHWSGCSVTCGSGQMRRERLCLDPRPANGGKDCVGSGIEHAACEITGCSEPLSAFALYGGSVVRDDDTGEITFTGVKLNTGGHYSDETGQYTAEYPGTYVFALHLYKKAFEATSLSCHIRKNGDSFALATVPGANDSEYYESSTATVLHLDQGDTVSVRCNHDGVATSTSFSGFLLKAD